jgi:MFS family permease
MGVIAVYRRVLGNGALARVLFGEFVSSIGDWLYLVALLVLIWNETRDPVILGIVGAARIVPYILLSVPAGIIADRYDRRLVLLVTDIVRGVIMVGIAAAVVIDAPIMLIVALAITATCFSAFFSPTIGAFLPSLVRDESELGPANSAWSSLENLAFFVGPAIAALLLSIGSIALAFLLNALTFAVVALVLLRLPTGRPTGEPAATGADGDEQPARTPSSLRAVLQPVFRPLVGLSILNMVSDFIFGGLSVITVILAVDVFRVDEAAGTGLLNSAIGVGGIVGALVAGALVLRRRLAPPLLIGAGGLALGLVVLGEAPADVFSVALVAMAVTAAGALLVQIVNTTLLQRIVPDAVRGRTLGGMETLSITAYAAGSFVMPLLAASQPAAVLVVSALVVVLAAVVSVALIGHHSLQEPADDVRHRLADVPIFAGLPPARLEAAMMRATVRQMTRGEKVISQGDEADFFYVIVDGTVEVTQADAEGQQRTLREMKHGDFFGEIGLLSRVPRTATVTALTNGELIALDKQTFLDLVEGGPGLTYRLLDLHRGAISGVSETVPASQPASR